jgi:hypothetical protein
MLIEKKKEKQEHHEGTAAPGVGMAKWKGEGGIGHEEEGHDRGVTLTSINALPKVLRLNE